jgi:hypothetical protein
VQCTAIKYRLQRVRQEDKIVNLKEKTTEKYRSRLKY